MVLRQGTVIPPSYALYYLCRGGMSVIYRAVSSNGATFLAKEVNATDANNVAALTKERNILSRLNHPGIVKMVDAREWEGFYYLILEFIEGGSLEQQMSPFDGLFLNEKVVRAWALELCEILGYLHSQNPPIIYRDLKPGNILRDKKGRLRLIDFGVASYLGEGAEGIEKQAFGTALTASPEHYLGRTDTRSDIFSLGASLYHLLSNGRGDRDSPCEFKPLRKLNANVSERLEQIIMRCLALNPEDRYQSIVEVAAAIRGGSENRLPEIPAVAKPLPTKRRLVPCG